MDRIYRIDGIKKTAGKRILISILFIL